MSHSSKPCPASHGGGGRAGPPSEPLWHSAVASAHRLTASATAAVAGRGGMHSCIGSSHFRHKEHVIRTAIGIPQDTEFTSLEHKSASHTKETQAEKLHTKPKHVANCSIQASPDRDTETASLSLPPTHDMNSTQGHCSTQQLHPGPATG
ncbi:hypothetical protein NQZ68_022121 [Dissostichus eleginoides]|nr:hypothetical protein NQZ68_022121 [Dissostichus eleginoides]